MNNNSAHQFYICTITRDGQLCDLKIYLGDYAEAALQKFMARRRHALLKRRGLPTWFGTPTVCSNEHFKSVNEGCEIEASPLKDPLRQLSVITGNNALERSILDMEQGKREVAPAVIRALERGLFQLAAITELATKRI